MIVWDTLEHGHNVHIMDTIYVCPVPWEICLLQ